MTVKDVAARMLPRYQAALTADERMAILREWDRELLLVEPEEPPPYDARDPGLDEVVEKAWKSWERRHGRRGVVDFKRRAAGEP